ncbi:PleD family two-component system response regulator [Anabaena cylindrica FACHB-243]|uniref:Response regulator receiver modulated diguanylate cyclase n=1 Tax=Anabaena cylindrica (strain ATCC 27899 / PCC 7122) TaxID=272123 RepID=K9ZJP9_ANACC|nr:MULTISPECIES: PleD family two-component system response regulator [Anabaena]AFZ58752.1 response regulator receiver modulated diguanylate cyclase [Anabaena cylindrica PCC 7122]MBD2420094.1 PleD family two-component system response regulator [Anabaena cylindrica FACHB-243]MBY5285393.1 PleD family two-component system response regulator [Anabaena sp. CCAP 1446/1C]MBY5306566.1 PleD family two-component system response regulator [Anabaena sp. CCAP 1446/1C]MCM2407009.1 PleD family two-component s
MYLNRCYDACSLILIVDDNPDNLRLLSKMLESKGFKVKKTVSGQVAIQAAKIEPPDLILLDINMPDINGYEVCRQLKSQPETANIPIIFISALDQTTDKIMAFEIGGVDYITKPFQELEVLARVKNQLIIYQQHRQLIVQNQQLQAEIKERQRIEEALLAVNHQLQLFAILDGLTGVANRRKFDEYLNLEWQRLSRENLPLSLLLCDVDFFKNYNDTYGHLSGDYCLQQIAKTLKSSVKYPTDLLARYGGEEFAVILSNTNFQEAVGVAEEIRQEVYNLKIPHAQSRVDKFVTVSIGVTTIFPNIETIPNTLIEIVDQALYTAKAQGRNRIIAKSVR